MSCTKAVPVITMEKLCEEKLRCSVCDTARAARRRSGAGQDGDRPVAQDPKPYPGTGRERAMISRPG